MSWEKFGKAPGILREVVESYSGPDAEQVRGFYSHLEKKARQADIDKLTGLRSRDYTEEKLIEELKKTVPKGRRRYDADNNLPVSVGLLDLDGFKEVNDELGHLEGNRVLSDASVHYLEALSDVFGFTRESDVVGRYGGDEILLVLPNTEMLYACIAVNRIKERISEQIDLHDVTLSAGVTDSEIVGVPLVMDDAGIYIVSKYFEHEGLIEKNNLKKTIERYAGQRGMKPSDVRCMLDNVYRFLRMTERNPDMIISEGDKIIVDLMIKYADKALYNAKQNGKNLVCCYSKHGLYL